MLANARQVLIVAAHPDDEALGCGGTLVKLAAKGLVPKIVFFTDGEGSRTSDIGFDAGRKRASAAISAATILGAEVIRLGQFPDNALDTVPLLTLVQFLEEVISQVEPDMILTHWVGDLNVDHQIVSRAVLTATRPQRGMPVKSIFSFEIPSSSEWNFSSVQPFAPDCYVNIEVELEKKLEALRCYESELRPFPHPRSLEAIRSLAIFRGVSAGFKYGEAFKLMRSLTD
jgi:LmbE family N-acetylglucosaminyl deacetylase